MTRFQTKRSSDVFPANRLSSELGNIRQISRAFVILGLIETSSALSADVLEPEPLLRIASSNGVERLAIRGEIQTHGLKPLGETFMAVCSSAWPEGLVPIFRIEENGKFELRRTPPRGQENYTEPFFFALPCEDEPETLKIAGTWTCVATNGQSKHYPAWELTVDRGRIAGRFDQQTEYRFAFVSGGAFRSNHFELKIDYINDRYTLVGEWRDGKLNGHWHHEGETDQGTWEATRPSAAPALPKNLKALPLYEWHRTGETIRRYSTEAINASGWERASHPICRVWQIR